MVELKMEEVSNDIIDDPNPVVNVFETEPQVNVFKPGRGSISGSIKRGDLSRTASSVSTHSDAGSIFAKKTRRNKGLTKVSVPIVGNSPSRESSDDDKVSVFSGNTEKSEQLMGSTENSRQQLGSFKSESTTVSPTHPPGPHQGPPSPGRAESIFTTRCHQCTTTSTTRCQQCPATSTIRCQQCTTTSTTAIRCKWATVTTTTSTTRGH
uniref:Uncharacterized protein n=1 Tax=Ciona savignyi TaxID=51511 RepID=H2YLG3_CIOSA